MTAHSTPDAHLSVGLRYPLKRIGRTEGLHSAQVHSVAVSQDGCVWGSGPTGLFCYDGSRVRTFTVAEGLSSQGLRGLRAASTGELWVGFDGGVDCVQANGRIVRMSGGDRWGFGPADTFATLPDGSLYIATSNGLITRTAEGTFRQIDHSVLGRDVIRALAVGTQGELLVASAQAGVSICRQTIWQTLDNCVYEQAGSATLICADVSGGLFIGGDKGLVWFSDAHRAQAVDAVFITKGPVSAALACSDELWVAVSNELRLFKQRGDQWEFVGTVATHVAINDLCVDSIGNIWCATDASGLLKVSALRNVIEQPALENVGQTYCVKPAKHGSLLIGTESALLRARPDSLNEYEVLAQLEYARVWDALETQEGLIWIATHFTGLLCIDAARSVSRIGADHAVLGAPNRCLMEFNGALWVGTLRGLVALRDGEITEMVDEQARSLGYVYTLHAHANSLWIGTLGRGLWRYQKATGLQQVVGNGLTAAGNTYAIAVRHDGEMAVVQDNRIVRIDNKGARTLLLQTSEAAAGWAACFDDAGRLCLGTSQGMDEYDFDRGRRVRQIRCGGISVAGWEFTSSRSLYLDDQKQAWCGLNSGLTIVACPLLDAWTQAPQARLLNMKWSNITPTIAPDGHTVVAAGRWRLDCSAFAAWMVDEGDVFYRCMLVGFDETWSPLQREADFTFTSLPPGQYLLRLQAWSPLCGEGPVCEAATFEVKAPWWAARLGWLAGTIEAARDTLGGQERNRRLLRVNEELAHTVQQRTEELVHTNTKLINANTQLSALARVDALTRVPNRLAFNEVATREWKRSLRDGSPIALLLIDIDFFKSYNDQYGHLEGDRCLKQVAQALNTCVRDGIDFFARFGGEEFVASLSHCDGDEALAQAKRMCTTISKLQITHAGSPWNFVTVSVGVCSIVAKPDITLEDALASADKALFDAKRTGRNQASYQELNMKQALTGPPISVAA